MWLGAGATLCTVGLYVYKFAPGHWFELSSSHDVWAAFGTYVGGILGPYFSFLAFVVLVLTVVLQARQLEIVRDQADFEEIQRVMSTIASRMDGQLSQIPEYHAAAMHVRDAAPLTLWGHISALGTRELTATAQTRAEAFDDDVNDAIRKDIRMSVNSVSLELHQLGWCMQKYKEQGGNVTVLDFYRMRFGMLACWMAAIGELQSELAREALETEHLTTVMYPKRSG
jgi:hypothetical protein